ncbi:MAG: tRNA uridine(34) 5-carboxymethylaminomethyl modification radical SAM/GNAT enzyme Elp3, partial [Acidobacteriota bacterium]|nr:tRNA uridine(34) 5-carboxymethylaminomethyl modification radical SAM/GNAT enzyme Elp3 [Acidobacteriota bacterium]
MSRGAGGRYAFDPGRHEAALSGLVERIRELDAIDPVALGELLRRYPKDGRGFFSKSEIIRGFRHLNAARAAPWDERAFLDKLRMKPVRTASGVAPVTVLTKPFPCPGRCIFCPSDVRMPKSYLSAEPGAQRAAQHQFDPYLQTLSRLVSYHHTGHRCDKVELIILGGTWTSYPEPYQIWFVKRCFDALAAFARVLDGWTPRLEPNPAVDFRDLDERVDGRRPGDETRYNEIVRRFAGPPDPAESASWRELFAVQRANERARARCVGLVVETRPDHLTLDEAVRLRRLGATKVQIGIQSLSDEVLAANRRGHDVAATRRALRLLRRTGFKIHAHWMPNLYGSTPGRDVEDFERLFADPGFRPDELKIYPCSLIASAELMAYHEAGRWRPYEPDELLGVLEACLLATPEYCRLTRVIRDIPGTDIVAGNRLTNLRQIAERGLAARGLRSRDIRAREVGERIVRRAELRLATTSYETSCGRELFLQYVTADDRIAAFLRLSLPAEPETGTQKTGTQETAIQ